MLIDDLLNLSRMTRAEIRKESFDISTIAHSVVESLQEAHAKRRIEFWIEDGLKRMRIRVYCE